MCTNRGVLRVRFRLYIIKFLINNLLGINGTEIKSWGLCLPDCVYVVPEVSCLAPPPVPQFGRRNESGYVLWENYHSSWFNLTFIDDDNGDPNHADFNIFRKERKKLFQPWMKYDVNDVNEKDIEFIAHDNNDHFNDVYEIVKNDSKAIYTCPLGWVFQDSHNISQVAYCRNWTWEVDFNTTKPCIRKQ